MRDSALIPFQFILCPLTSDVCQVSEICITVKYKSSMWLALFTFLVILSRVGVAALNRGPLSVPETNINVDGSVLSQTVHVSNATASGGCMEDCDCHMEGRCKPCSRFEMSRQVHECLRTGYRQWAYCSRDKANKYVSCHYHTDPGKNRAFWLFQVIVLLIGFASLAVVHWRQTRIDKIVTHRIEQQIRA